MSVSLATVATQFLERHGLAKSTIRSYEGTLIPFLQEYGRIPLEIIDRKTVCEYLNSLENLAYTTHHRHQAIIQALFNFALEQGYIKTNPIARLRRRKPDPEKGEHQSDETIRYLTNQQIKLLYQVIATDRRMNALVRLLHRSGARIGEVLALNVTDIDWQNQKFYVLGKGNKARWCFYSQDAAEALQNYRQFERPNTTITALFTAQHQFTDEITRLSYRTVHKHWALLISSVPELAGTRLHDLRHTFATERVGLMGIEELRALMGHTNIQTTLRYQKVTSARAEYIAKEALNSLMQSES
ncbi:tyrosine-type recombinase/integrase [Kamptonema sp. UHCC 0994]|uniref:tyrosine-type recombinase/integrase n=1 Tax=Kamptonema sp. UHCC 0994 TaxID=3031329 RepID=UPI0023BAE6FB|nr:tyrosine-type recombinase/integrase [Kamptonema sp. UHCC 0994]MDF0556555.1 tyrosine-type recombinase/integrase [Kamptonema sp. UHCC 0994]